MTEEIKGDPIVYPATFAEACARLGFANELLSRGDTLDADLKKFHTEIVKTGLNSLSTTEVM